MANVGEMHRSRHSRPALGQPAFHCKALDKYRELQNFEMKVIGILQTRAHELNNEDGVSIIEQTS